MKLMSALIYKIGGEWRRAKKTRPRPPRPFMRPTYDEYWKGANGKGFAMLDAALIKKINGELG